MLMQSCTINGIFKAINLHLQTRKEYYNQCQDFIYTDNKIRLAVKINGIEDTIIFDSGSSGDLLLFVFRDSNGLANAYKRKVTLPEGKSYLYLNYTHCDIETNLVKGTLCVAETAYYPSLSLPYTCIPSLVGERKLIGYSLIPGEIAYQKIMVLDFSNHQICLYDTLSFDTSAYIPIKSAIRWVSKICIYLTIDNVEHKFFFDTGCSTGLLLNKKNLSNNKQENDILLDGDMFMSAKGIIDTDTTIIGNRTVYLTEQDSIMTNKITYANNIDGNLAGLPFISQFDWIIDTKNNHVYAKPIVTNQKDSIEVEWQKATDFTYIVVAKNGYLTIIIRNLSNNPLYPVYAKIKSVNGETITPDNICSYQTLLNENMDWSTFQLEFFE